MLLRTTPQGTTLPWPQVVPRTTSPNSLPQRGTRVHHAPIAGMTHRLVPLGPSAHVPSFPPAREVRHASPTCGRSHHDPYRVHPPSWFGYRVVNSPPTHGADQLHELPTMVTVTPLPPLLPSRLVASCPLREPEKHLYANAPHLPLTPNARPITQPHRLY